MTGRYIHLPPVEEPAAGEPAIVALPGPAYGSGETAAKALAEWLTDSRAVDSRRETVDGQSVWVHHETLTRYQAAVAAVREAAARTTVPHTHTRTCPHPRAIRDIARAWYGLELTAVEIITATAHVMAEATA